MYDLEALRTPARPVSQQSARYPVPPTSELLPIYQHAIARPKHGIYICYTLAGRPRSWHDFDREGACIHCHFQDADHDTRLAANEARGA